MAFDLVLTDARLCPMTDATPRVIEDGVLALRDGRIAWVGARAGFAALHGTPGERVSLHGRCITPGLIDCHTHLVHAGRRTDEFVQKLEGVPYAEIARRGGGIVSTVRATRAAGYDTLLALAERRARRALACGTTRVEIKSGYGLDPDTERRMLRVARALATRLPIAVHTTFLGAHAVPPEYAGRADAYLDLVIDGMLRPFAAEGLVDSVDAFCEHIAFSPRQVRRLFDAARALGLPARLHADQLSDLGGAALAAEYAALSADHLEYTSEAGVRALAAAGTVAVLLPGAYHYLRETVKPPVAALRAAGVPIAVATDWNPGSSPVAALPVAMNLACLLFGLTPWEALAGTTRHAARALGCAHECGTLEPGKRADLAVWDVEDPAEIVERLGDEVLSEVWVGGKVVRRDARP